MSLFVGITNVGDANGTSSGPALPPLYSSGMDSRSAPARLRGLPTWLVNQAAQTGQQLVGRHLATAGVHRYHFSTLSALAESGPMSQAELGRRCGLDPSDVTATVAALAERGSVEKAPDPADRRRNSIRLTGAGRRELRTLDRLVSDAQTELLAPLDEGERALLVRLLSRVVDHHAERREDPLPA